MAKIEVFARKASGLVRHASWFDGFLTSIGTMNMIWLAVSFIWALSLFPGAEFHISIIIAVVFCLFNALLFSQFATMMPRSGGDYVFNTRGLSPGAGFAVNFSMVVWNLFWTAYTCYLLSAVSASSAFTIIGEATGTQWMIDLGAAAAEPLAAFIIGTLVILFIGLVTYFGIKTFFRVMKVAFVIGMIGVIVLIGVMLASSHETFVNVFNSYVGSGAYTQTLTDAAQNGWVRGISWDATVLAIAIAFQPLGFSVWSSYISGEIKDAKRFKVNALAIVGSLVTMGVFMLILWFLSITVFGYDFMGAVGYLFYNVPEASALAIPPGTHFFGSLLAPNLLVALVIGVGFIAWAFLYAPQSMLMVVRCMLAWSMERLAPEKLGEVNPKHHTPTWAIIVATIISIIFLGFFILTIYAFIPFDVFSIYGFNAFLGGGTLTFMAVALSGIIFPFRKKTKEIFESSPVNQRVAGIPLLAINGLITLVFMGFITYLYLSLPEFGVATMASLVFIIGVYVLGAIWYVVARSYQKRKGVPIELAFKEIPPE